MGSFGSEVAALAVAAGVAAGDGARAGRQRHHRRHRKGQSGGAIPGATVNVVNEATSVSVEATPTQPGRIARDARAGPVPGGNVASAGSRRYVRRIVLEAGQTATMDVTLSPSRFSQEVVVTARRVEEVAQDVPIPVSVMRGDLVSDTGSFNVNRLKEMIPTVQFYSTNPRNSAINIRGLGAPSG